MATVSRTTAAGQTARRSLATDAIRARNAINPKPAGNVAAGPKAIRPPLALIPGAGIAAVGATVLTETLNVAGVPTLTLTGCEGTVQVAPAGAPEHVKLTLTEAAPVAVIGLADL